MKNGGRPVLQQALLWRRGLQRTDGIYVRVLIQGLQIDSSDKGAAAPTGTQRAGKGLLIQMKTDCATKMNFRTSRSAERIQRRMRSLAQQRRVEERQRDIALVRLVNVLEHAHAEDVPHLTGRFRVGDEFSRLARLRAAHATYALATMPGVERPSEGAFLRI